LVAAVVGVLALLALPPSSSGQPNSVNKLLQDLKVPVQVPDVKVPGLRPQPQRERPSSAVEPRQTPGQGGYQPPLHGNNPHAQGDVITGDLGPSGERPLGGNPATGPEDIVVGRARGEQGANGQYHGHVTIVALFGNELLGVDTNPGQTRAGPLDALQQGVLNQLCTASQICLNVLRADSSTTSTGSTNRFTLANATIGNPQTGLLSLTAGDSNGNISQDANCQTANSSSTVADANIAGGAVADVSQSSSSSRACNDGTAPTQTNSSSVIGLGGTNVPIPAPGCANGTPDTVTGIPVLAPIVCNANDSNGLGEAVTQAGAPYGVREALTVFALEAGGTALLKVTTGASETRVQAPPAAPSTRGRGNDGTDTRDDDDDGDGRDDGRGDPGGPGGPGRGDGPGGGGSTECSDGRDNDGDGKIDLDDPGCESASDDSESDGTLAFTGQNLLLMAIIGLATLFLGLMTLRFIAVSGVRTAAGAASGMGSAGLRLPGAGALGAAFGGIRRGYERHRRVALAIALLALAVLVALVARGGGGAPPVEPRAQAPANAAQATVDPAIGASVVAPPGWTAEHEKRALRLISPDRTTLLAFSAPGPAQDAHQLFETTLTQIRRGYRDVSVTSLAGQKLAGRPAEAAVVSALNRRGERVQMLVGTAEGKRRAYQFQVSTSAEAPARRLVQAQTALASLKLDVAP